MSNRRPAPSQEHPAPSGRLLPTLFRTEQRYGWSVGMRTVTHALLSGVSLPPGSVADLGCGGGAMATELRRVFPGRTVLGLDVHPLAVAQAAKSGSGQVLQADVANLPLADGSMALLLALDSFDQQGVDFGRILSESRRVLCDGGLLVIRVSTMAWLAGPHDTAFNTARRYDRWPFVDAVTRAGFGVERCTCANMLLMPPMVAVRLLQQRDLLPMNESLFGDACVNGVAAAALLTEARYLRGRDLPLGLSLYVMARKG